MHSQNHRFLIAIAFAVALLTLLFPGTLHAAAGDLYQSDPQHGSINRYAREMALRRFLPAASPG
jgi:hypothetical protein